ncbi:MAG: hypothetical protein J2P17_23230 [Mycobacterium sp.]|nr:hypothetical protein [Mycobacterium sp.]
MSIRPRLMFALIGASSLLVPFLGAQVALASTAPATTTPTCVVHSTKSQVETGEGVTTSSIADVIQVECQPQFSEQYVEISSAQLDSLCHNTLSWYSDSTSALGGGWGTGETFDVYLDDDGNATAVVWGGPSCAAGTALITADLTVAPFTTARTHFVIKPPQTTTRGIYPRPLSEVEDATWSGVDTVLNIEFPSVYGEDTVEVSSPQLYDHCHGNIVWVGADETILGTDTKSVTATLDNNGNTFVVAIGGPSCATGESLVTADLMAPPYTTLHNHFTILSPRPTV